MFAKYNAATAIPDPILHRDHGLLRKSPRTFERCPKGCCNIRSEKTQRKHSEPRPVKVKWNDR